MVIHFIRFIFIHIYISAKLSFVNIYNNTRFIQNCRIPWKWIEIITCTEPHWNTLYDMFLHIFLLEVYIDNVFVMSSRETYSSYFSFSLLQSFSLTHINTELIYHQLSLNNYVPLKFSDVHFLPLHMTTRDRIRRYGLNFNMIPRMDENWCIENMKRIIDSFIQDI